MFDITLHQQHFYFEVVIGSVLGSCFLLGHSVVSMCLKFMFTRYVFR